MSVSSGREKRVKLYDLTKDRKNVGRIGAGLRISTGGGICLQKVHSGAAVSIAVGRGDIYGSTA